MGRLTINGREPGEFTFPWKSHHLADLGDTPEDVSLEIEDCSDAAVIEENPTTRLVLRANTFPPNNGTEGFNLDGYLCHARRSPSRIGEAWEDVEHFHLTNLKAGQYVRIRLGPNNLKSLFLALAAKYQQLGGLEAILDEAGIKAVDSDHVTIIEGKERDTLQALMERDDDFWDNVAELDTRNALETKALQLEHQRRTQAVAVFKEHLDAKDWSEEEWETFFKENEWIFGLGLSYHYLDTRQNQAHLGGTNITGRGTDKVDYLMSTSGDTRFTVLVDIKRPDKKLLQHKEYRSDIFHVSAEVAGGVAQLQSYCYTWTTDGARQTGNAPDRLGAYTYEPKGMLIVGDLAEFGDKDAMRKSFELFRRHVNNPQILTFDEVYSRAEYMVTHTESQVGEESGDEWDVLF